MSIKIYKIAFYSLFILAFFACNQPKPVTLTFAFGPDDGEQTIQYLIDQFNQEHAGKIKVNWKESSRIPDEFYETLAADFEKEAPEIDVFGSDVVWTGVFGSNGSVEDLSKSFYRDFNPGHFMKSAMNSAVYNFRVYGVPWYTDAAMIFYRKDLLRKNGFDQAPSTWDELKDMARVVMDRENIPYGYVFQGDKYEGGVANACEFIWNAGGQITMDNLSITGFFEDNYIAPSIITVDSRASENGFAMARSLVEEGISPESVVYYREAEAEADFINGKSVFMRGWPGIYGMFQDENAKVRSDQIGVIPIPVLEQGAQSFSCLGGWNLMVNAYTSAEKKEAAWEFIQYLVAAPQQRYRAMKSGILPSLKVLYDDKELLDNVPVISLARQEIQNARSRPVSPYYMEYSPEIATIFHQTLKGELLPEYAVFMLQEYLEDIQMKNMVADN